MDFRGRQAWSFWSDFPYVILSIGHFMIDPTVSEDTCRERAAQLVQKYDGSPSRSSLGLVTWRFFGQKDYRKTIIEWSVNKTELNPGVRSRLMGYITALVAA